MLQAERFLRPSNASERLQDHSRSSVQSVGASSRSIPVQAAAAGDPEWRAKYKEALAEAELRAAKKRKMPQTELTLEYLPSLSEFRIPLRLEDESKVARVRALLKKTKDPDPEVREWAEKVLKRYWTGKGPLPDKVDD